MDSTHDDMMMLWSVLADAGPRTGDGDVSAISPTVDDGAGSMMFRFGPTRVAGFDFEFMLASVLDLRTLGCLHMSEQQRKQAIHDVALASMEEEIDEEELPSSPRRSKT